MQPAAQTIQSAQAPVISTPAASLAPPPPNFPYQVYHPNAQHAAQANRSPMQAPTSAPPQTWQAPNGIAPQQTHLAHPQHGHPHMMGRPQMAYGREEWAEAPPAFHQMGPGDPNAMGAMPENHTPGYYDARFRDGQQGWAEHPQEFYNQPVRTFHSFAESTFP